MEQSSQWMELELCLPSSLHYPFQISPFLLLFLLPFFPTGRVHSSIPGTGGGTASAGKELDISEDSADGDCGTGGPEDPGNCKELSC